MCISSVAVWYHVFLGFLLFLEGCCWVAPDGFSACSIPALLSLLSTTFLRDCRRGESLGATTCLISVGYDLG